MPGHKPYQITLVSHTHWDRAWYCTFQEYRVRLVRLIDTLLDLLKADRDYRVYMLDGQMSVLEDYLEARPSQAEDLRAFCRSGRIQVGPWFVLADEFLVSPEALIRNLRLGHKMGESLRRRVQNRLRAGRIRAYRPTAADFARLRHRQRLLLARHGCRGRPARHGIHLVRAGRLRRDDHPDALGLPQRLQPRLCHSLGRYLADGSSIRGWRSARSTLPSSGWSRWRTPARCCS